MSVGQHHDLRITAGGKVTTAPAPKAAYLVRVQHPYTGEVATGEVRETLKEIREAAFSASIRDTTLAPQRIEVWRKHKRQSKRVWARGDPIGSRLLRPHERWLPFDERV